jgi:hypothetical protein
MKLSLPAGGVLLSHLRRPRWLVAVAGVAMSASALCGWHAGAHARNHGADGPSARLTRVVHSEGTGTGVSVVTADGRRTDLAEGAEVPCGTTVETDPRARARLELADGTVVALDRATRIAYDDPREVSLQSGAIIADVVPGGTFGVRSALFDLRSSDGRFALTADDRRASVGVARGDAVVKGPRDSATVHAGEEAEVASGTARLEITATGDLGQRIAFGEGFDVSRDDDGPPSGLGELRARKPGSKDEIDGAVRLARHDVKARIAGAMARTEVDETFVNTTDRELEGVWRFPLPPDARIERLALEVDGKLVEGEFVDAKKASGIWRGVIQHAAPGAPRPVEEIVWVPGPWRDPALLEWQRGGRAELKIFPIPRKGTRRVVLAYTQHVEPAGGVRRYVYPLASHAGATPIDQASFDVRVVGADPTMGVHARGYDLTPGEPSESSLAMSRSAFTPSGDLVVEYATTDRASEASAVGFTPVGGSEDGFVAIALRPRLPARIAERSRDQVIVVDTGRAMFGERLRRASRLAVELAQQMDRRDRVTVLACDLECRPMPGGWHGPGAAAAHDVDAFLAGVEADGASDLVGAVREAGRVSGREGARDLRVVVLSDGAASAGTRGKSRVAAEVSESLSDPRTEVVTVPIGSDADVDTLGEIARGGGGTVVPYATGESLDAAALNVLSATYGAMLRDAELILPDGLHDIAPATLPPLRAGAETIVGARLKGDHASGDLVLRGKLGGDPFEARWPIDVRATADEGNAWAARTWAAQRVADDERAGDDASRAEAAALSHRFRVPSRFTSLLVLESEAMFHAFGIARSESAFEWTGENEAHGTDVTTADDEKRKDEEGAVGFGAGGAGAGGGAAQGSLGILGALDSVAAPKKSAPQEDNANPYGGATRAAPSPPPSPVAGAPILGPTTAASAFVQAAPAPTWAPSQPQPIRRPEPRARPGRWMRRVWFRTATVAADDRPPVDTTKLEAARVALAGSPDLRQRHADLAKLLVREGNVEDLEAVATRWASRDPLDPDLLTVRAAARAWRGDRDGAMRVLSGMLASPATASSAQADIATSLARAEERALHADTACALRVSAAESKPEDVDVVAAAVACERGRGADVSATRWLTSAKDDAMRSRVSAAAAKLLTTTRPEDALFGDVVVDATWDAGAGADLDVAVIDPSGKRMSWASAARSVRARDCTSRTHEALAVSSGAAGAFIVEVVRAEGREGTLPVSGKLRITSLGRTQTVPFTLVGQRDQVARVDVRFESRLESLSSWSAW